ncbi:hypothetical protein [Halorhabdus sp. CBA1104]|uniref:hypothetical protein n=1 Tax=Halorhabdus sp. CBA1104 TaxID=1380432 RepID=UPI0018A6CE88|nr:hypothetical protein [Halorhabdus sp. CBA1104]
MSWIRSSKGVALLAVLVLTFAAVGAVTAASVQTDTPDEAQVGEEITVSATITNVYETSDQWRLNGTTALTNVTGWTVTKVTPSGEENTTQFDGATDFEVAISGEENLKHVNVTITGDVPPVEAYSYDPPQSFTAAQFDRVQGNNVNEIRTISVHHYTPDSQSARQLIDEADQAVNDSSSDDARSDLDSAISAYENENFPNAENLSQSAIDAAESAEQSAQTTQLILYGAGGLVVLVLVGGGIYYWRSQQESYDKLR